MTPAKQAEGTAPRTDDRSLDLAMRAVQAALDKKGLEPVLIDVRELASYTDYIVVVSGSSDRHVQALADAVLDDLKKAEARPLGVEGVGHGQWTLVDFGDIIVHVFYHPMREFYDLESLWIDAPRVDLDVPAEARVSAETYYS